MILIFLIKPENRNGESGDINDTKLKVFWKHLFPYYLVRLLSLLKLQFPTFPGFPFYKIFGILQCIDDFIIDIIPGNIPA